MKKSIIALITLVVVCLISVSAYSIANTQILGSGLQARAGSAKPAAVNQILYTSESTARMLNLTAKDSDGSTRFSILSDPSHGTLNGTSPYLTYTPVPGYRGLDSFSFQAIDHGVTSTGNVSIVVDECRCVIYRFDDIGDYWLSHIQSNLFDLFLNKSTPLSTAIVMRDFGEDPTVMEPIKRGVSSGLFEPVVHGWTHADYSQYNLTMQTNDFKRAQAKMVEIFGRPSSVYAAPQDFFNTYTPVALRQANISIFTVAETMDDYPYFNSGGNASYAGNYLNPAHVPSVTSDAVLNGARWSPNSIPRILSAVNASISKYGYAVITFHPQDFSIPSANGALTDSVNQTQVERFATLLDTIKAKGIPVANFEVVARGYPRATQESSSGLSLPSILFTSPNPNSILTGLVHFTGTASSNLPIIDVEIGIRGQANSFERVIPFSKGNWSTWSLDYRLPLGTEYMTARVTDVSGRVVWNTLHIVVPPPTVTVTSPADYQKLTTGLIKFAGAASSGAQITAVELSIDGNASSYQLATPKAPGDWSTWSISYNLPVGNHYYVARVTDNLGRQTWNSIALTGK
jgi:peptidoglycan/xylan/chitin deacetylase (PgdA/CDA1 family)